MTLTAHSPISFRLVAITLFLALISAVAFPSATNASQLEITGTAGATVLVNDKAMGFLPLKTKLTLAPGIYEIKSELPGYLPYETTVTLQEVNALEHLHIRLLPLSKKTAWTGNLLFAGLGQHYMGKNFKGYLFNAAEAGGLLAAIAGELQRTDYRKDYLLLKEKYDSAINPEDLEYYQAQSEKAYSNMEDAEGLRNTGLMIAGGAIALSIVDALLFFPNIEAGTGEVPIQMGSVIFDGPGFASQSHPLQTVHAAFKLEF